MSLFDKASLVFSGKAAAGKDGKAYNIKPVEKLKVDELITNNKLLTSDGWAFSDSNITVANGKIVFNNAAQYATARWDTDVFVEGKTYKISFKVEDFGGGASNSKLLAQQANNTQIDTNIDRDGKYSFYYTPGAPDGTNNQNKFQLKTVTDSVKTKVSDFSIKEVEQKANDFTFTRGSNLTATLEGADGLIKKGRENLFTYSNDFDNAIWVGSSTWTSGQGGYDGSTNAWSFNKSSPTGSDFYNQFFHGLHTFSIYVKKQSSAGLAIYAFYDWNGSSFDNNVRVVYNLDNGASVYQSSIVSTTSEAIGNDWWRISMTVEQNDMRWYLYTTDGTQTLVDNVTVTLQNAQLEQGLVATPYIDRTGAAYSTAGVLENEPRYDYSGGDATLLLEPQRRNLVKHSEYLSNYNTSNATKTINALTSPEGVNNAATINVTSNSGSVYAQSGSVVESVEAETKYTFSFYVKRGTNTENYLAVRDQSAEAFISEDIAYTASTTEWKRISHTFTTPAGCTSIRLYPQRYSSGGQGTTHLFGIQLEKGSYATSYIPTYGSAATREGEGDSLSSFTCTLDKPLSKKYTLFLDLQVDNLERPTTNFDDIFVARAADGNNYAFRLEGYHDPAPNPDTYSLRAFMYKSGQSGAFVSTEHTNGIQLGVRNKIAIVFDEEVGVKVFHNGALEKEKLEAASFYDVKFLEGGSQPRSKTLLHGVQAYDVALSDPECVSLTTI